MVLATPAALFVASEQRLTLGGRGRRELGREGDRMLGHGLRLRPPSDDPAGSQLTPPHMLPICWRPAPQKPLSTRCSCAGREPVQIESRHAGFASWISQLGQPVRRASYSWLMVGEATAATESGVEEEFR